MQLKTGDWKQHGNVIGILSVDNKGAGGRVSRSILEVRQLINISQFESRSIGVHSHILDRSRMVCCRHRDCLKITD